MSDQTPPQYPSYPGPDQPADSGWVSPDHGWGGPAYGLPGPDYGTSHARHLTYASWGTRVGGYLVDGLIALGVCIVPLVIGAVLTESSDPGMVNTGNLLIVLSYVLNIGFQVWNMSFRLGRTGQSLGQKVVGIQVVRESDGAFLGAGTAFGRMLMLVILGGLTCYINFLWPLWDKKNQTLHDKVVGSVVLTK